MTAIVCIPILVLIVFGLPSFLVVKERAKEAEAKEGLHTIEIAVNRYETDDSLERESKAPPNPYPHKCIPPGEFPAFLVGGTSKQDEIPSDPLLRKGYLNEYPRNPFARQTDLNPHLEGTHPERFGLQRQLMGNVMADARYARWSSATGLAGRSGDLPTYADIEFKCWDRDSDGAGPQFLPGAFYYKSSGFLSWKVATESLTKPVLPREVGQFTMGVFGGVHTKGKDTIGDEMPASPNIHPLWPWLRSQVSGSPKDVAGCPYAVQTYTTHIDQHAEFDIGNPNGIPDGTILMLFLGGKGGGVGPN